MAPTNMKEYMAKRRLNRRMKLLEMSGSCCEKCGSKIFLEFNHKDRLEKKFILSGHNLDKSWEKILDEWKKCELLCRECHVQFTKEQFKNKEIIPYNSLKHLPYICGTMRSYQEKTCRCDKCCKAKRAYRRKKISYQEELLIS